ncbi:MAG: hypothetical protein ACK5AZ_19400 [Bryobacteraceae bacterium]
MAELETGQTSLQPQWPNGKRFAFTIFDDPDGQPLSVSRLVYTFVKDIGLRTTIAVWVAPPTSVTNAGGETCGNPEYLDLLRKLQAAGFEIAWHLASPHTSTREQTAAALEHFRELFGSDPKCGANHFNGEAIYLGPQRLSGWRRTLYQIFTRGQTRNRFFGEVKGHPWYWGDLCGQRIQYYRIFVFFNLNTLAACPWMPYFDPERPYVNAWFAASEGARCRTFLQALCEKNQEQLEAEEGCCILYTHFGYDFVTDGKLNPEFIRLMERLSSRNGWFVPAGTILDQLAARQGIRILPAEIRRTMERSWLREKLLRGTS